MGGFRPDRPVSKPDKAVRFDKALLWDMAVGSSDGQAYRSGHCHAGLDGRIKHQLTRVLNRGNEPSTPYQSTASVHAKFTVANEDFLFLHIGNPDDRHSALNFTTNDDVSPQGTVSGDFVSVPEPNELRDACESFRDPIFNVLGGDSQAT